MRFLLIGDIVGKPGERIITRALAGLRQREGLDLVEDPSTGNVYVAELGDMQITLLKPNVTVR